MMSRLFWALLLALLPGCSLYRSLFPGPEKCKEIPLELFVKAGEVLNLSPEGQSLPVEVRAYLLKSTDKFDELDFNTLWRSGQEALGPTLIKTVTFTVFPAEEKIETVVGSPELAFVAIVGIFRQYDGNQWKKVVDVRPAVDACTPESLHTQIRAQLADNRVIAEPLKPAAE